MGQSIEDDSATNSLKEPLLGSQPILDDDILESLDTNSLTDDKAASECDTTDKSEQISEKDEILEQIGSPRTFYVIGHWIWLYFVWSIMRDLTFGNGILFDAILSILAWSLIIAGHWFFLYRLSVPIPGRKEYQRPAQVNQETLPAILSGVRVFCLDRWASSSEFLVRLVVSFLLYEICRSSSRCSALSTLVQKHYVFTDYNKDNGEGDDLRETDHLEAQNESQESEEPENLADSLNDNKDDPNSRLSKLPKRRNWGAIAQWIWLQTVWSIVLPFLAYDPTSLSYEEACILTWAFAMIGHGILLTVVTRSPESASFFCVTRETLPMMLSAFYVISMNDLADQFLVVIAAYFILTQTARAAWRFSLNLLFTTFAKMEKDYFERLKAQESEEAAALEAQMRRMAYLETIPRPSPAKRSKKLLPVMLVPICICLGLFTFRFKMDLALVGDLFIYLENNLSFHD